MLVILALRQLTQVHHQLASSLCDTASSWQYWAHCETLSQKLPQRNSFWLCCLNLAFFPRAFGQSLAVSFKQTLQKHMLPLFYQCLAANSLLLKLLSHLYLIFRASDENKHGWGKTHPKRCAPYQIHMATQCLDPQEVYSISDTHGYTMPWHYLRSQKQRSSSSYKFSCKIMSGHLSNLVFITNAVC